MTDDFGYDFDFPENGGVFLNGIDPDVYYPRANVRKKCDFYNFYNMENTTRDHVNDNFLYSDLLNNPPT